MFKGLFSKLIRKVIKNPLAADAIAAEADRRVKRELDKRTGGMASKVDDVI